MAFRFLSTTEFEALTAKEKLTYLSDAMIELDRTNVAKEGRGWHSLFMDGQQQAPQPESDPDSR